MLSLNKTRLITLVALLSTLAGALVFRTPAVLFLAATLLCAPLLAVSIGNWMSRGLRVSRQMPAVGTVGEVIRARVTVKNVGWIPALLVHARGRDESSGRGEDKTGAAFFEAQGEDELIVPILMPGAQFEGEVAWKLLRRGRFAWPGARAGALDPVGLSVTMPAQGASGELLVLPRPLGLRRLEARGGAAGLQQLKRPLATASADIHGVRPYQPGEAGRRIHWRATARTGELHVIEWEDETASEQTIFLDNSAPNIAGQSGDDTLESAIVAAASVAAFLLENGQRARIFWWAPGEPGASGPRLARVEARHRAGLFEILSALAQVAPCPDAGATLENLVRRVVREVHDTSESDAILLGSDTANWSGALVAWPGRARGLAFECASFESGQGAARFTLRAGGAGAVTATMRRAQTSKRVVLSTLPPSVRLVKRSQSLAAVLEQGF